MSTRKLGNVERRASPDMNEATKRKTWEHFDRAKVKTRIQPKQTSPIKSESCRGGNVGRQRLSNRCKQRVRPGAELKE
jgi:hypothetical protein